MPKLRTPQDMSGQLAQIFQQNPRRHFYRGPREPYIWPSSVQEVCGMYPLESLTVRVGGIQIAYAQELRLEKTIEGVRSLVIGHFATEAGMQRLGVGTAFAFAIGQAVADVYRGSQIIFAERTDRPHNRKFFEALGAHAVFLQSELTPRWHWKLPDFSTTTVSGP